MEEPPATAASWWPPATDGGEMKGYYHRHLEEESQQGELWQMIYVGVVLLIMFAALIFDKIGADLVLLTALTACMAGQIITVQEGVAGFSNSAVLTVMILFVVAAGIQLTGGLDWYMAKLLGRPKTVAGAQLRMMVPIGLVSCFLNNTPIVVVMTPIVQKWCRNLSMPVSQLLIPLTYAVQLGGTCTLIGTSTNLVVYGLLEKKYPGEYEIGLFSLGQYGVPVAFVGLTYILIFSPWTLPGGVKRIGTAASTIRELPMDDGSILLGALMTQWSPAAGRTVRRSGLRDTGGIYLVSVYRANTGNVHRAVGPDFVLNVGDILYFTGMAEDFGLFCAEHGLEVVTSEHTPQLVAKDHRPSFEEVPSKERTNEFAIPATANKTTADNTRKSVTFATGSEREKSNPENEPGSNRRGGDISDISSTDPNSGTMIIEIDVEHTRKRRLSMLGHDTDKLQAINKMTDAIRGYDNAEKHEIITGPPQVVVAIDSQSLEDVVIVGIKPGLLLSISQGLHTFGLQLHHTQAAVILHRSISVWRCEFIESNHSDPEKIEEGLRQLLEKGVGVGAEKSGGTPVIRVQVTDRSSLAHVSVADVDFRGRYKAAIMAVSKADGSNVENLRELQFSPGDILVLQASDDSPLLVRPPPDFYTESDIATKRKYSAGGFFRALSLKSKDNSSLFQSVAGDFSVDLEANVEANEEEVDDRCSVSYISNKNHAICDAWRDLRVLFHEKEADDIGNASREYLNPRRVTRKSEHIGKTVTQTGLDKLNGLFLIEVERPPSQEEAKKAKKTFQASVFDDASDFDSGLHDSINAQRATAVPPGEPLKAGDIIWFAGSAEAMADLRRVPGLESPEEEVLKEVKEKKFDRRLVQAVVAPKGPLVGRTPAELHFRTKYGAAVIAVHRHGKRIQDYPGKIKLNSGDVLLLEAGPTFIAKNADNQKSFTLISEVKDSKPPRLNMLKWALLITAIMLVFATVGPMIPVTSKLNISSLFVLGLIASIVMVSVGILSQQECRDAVNWEMYIMIASAYGIGSALEASGLANVFAHFLVAMGTGIGIGAAGVYGAVYLATFLISQILANNAAAALMFPVAIETANQVEGVDNVIMAYCLMFSASASFMSPFGYQCNMLVYGPGGYKVKDFMKIGTPMQLILWIFTTVILTNPLGVWWPSWVATFVCFVVVSAILVLPSAVGDRCARFKGSTKKPKQDRDQTLDGGGVNVGAELDAMNNNLSPAAEAVPPTATDVPTFSFFKTEAQKRREKIERELERIEGQVSDHPKFSPEWFALKQDILELRIQLEEDDAQSLSGEVTTKWHVLSF